MRHFSQTLLALSMIAIPAFAAPSPQSGAAYENLQNGLAHANQLEIDGNVWPEP